ncbi:MAG: putative DNA-binding domain-containing protein [Herbaspirillum sp.]|nr:putative DNA-binding domain-containing protein [Herbaspirillum sp.]
MIDDDYHQQFLQAIWHGQSTHPLVAALAAQPAFAVYRNTIFKGCVDALAGNYPTLQRLVGDACFHDVALVYAREHAPDDVCLINYGRGFAAFVAGVEALAELPYLPGVAALDRAWSEAHLAADDAPLEMAALHEALAQGRDVRLVLHAATRWHSDDSHPVFSIWSTQRQEEAAPSPELSWQGESALLTRPEGEVQWRAIGAGACAFLAACQRGTHIAEAAALAQHAEPGLDIALMLGELIQAGAFTSFQYQ